MFLSDNNIFARMELDIIVFDDDKVEIQHKYFERERVYRKYAYKAILTPSEKMAFKIHMGHLGSAFPAQNAW